MLSRLIDHIKRLHRLGRSYGINCRVLPSGVLIKYPTRLVYFGYVVSYSGFGSAWKEKTWKSRVLYFGYLILAKINNVKWRLEMLNGIF